MSNRLFSVKLVKPAGFPLDEFLRYTEKAAAELAVKGEEKLRQTTSTWRTKSPWYRTIRKTPNGYTVMVWTTDRIWGYLNEGTRIRHAVMSRDWVSKTRPGIGGGVGAFLVPGQGQGSVRAVGRRIVRPGIKPRYWSRYIARNFQHPARRIVEDYIAAAVAASGWVVK